MREITEQQIMALAPNSNAVSNGRKISAKGGFVRLERSADDTFYLGECTGSGKSNYITSADYINEDSPVFRCSCPSRQFPCKHSLALLFEMMAKKEFAVNEIPEDIIEKRKKKQAREEKAAAKAAGIEAEENTEGMTEEEKAKLAKKKAAAAKAGRTAREKKIKKQLEGLELTEKLITDLMSAGLGTMGGTAVKTYADLAKQLGDYYLPGPQKLLNKLILEITAFQKDGNEAHYDAAVEVLEKLWALAKKSGTYLKEKLESSHVDLDDNVLYEELGGIWKLTELEALGRGKKNASLAQLAFYVEYDEAGKQYIDTGCWVDLENGDISFTYNYRPLKSLKYIKQDDTLFGVVQVPSAVYYPGEGNLRVRWDGGKVRELNAEDLEKIRSFALTSINEEAKNIKNLLKNAMAQPYLLRLVAYDEIGVCGEDLVLRASAGDTILLGDGYVENTTERLRILPDSRFYKNQTMLAAFYYERTKRRLMAQPISIVAEDTILRLLY